MVKTISQLDVENKLKVEKRNNILNYLHFKYFLRFENSNIYIYYLHSYCANVYIINLENYTISEKCYHKDLVLNHLEKYDCFEIIVDRDSFNKQFNIFQHDVYKYAKNLSNKVDTLMVSDEKVFSSYPKLYKYDENKLIVNSETKNLTLEEYKHYIDSYNSSKNQTWESENQEKLSNVGKFAIGFTYVKQNKGNYELIEYFPRLFGKITKDTIHRKYSIEPSAIFYGLSNFCEFEKKKHGNIIGYSHLRILQFDEIKHFKMLWNEFIHFIIKNTNKNKIDY